MADINVQQSGGDYSELGTALSNANAGDAILINGTWTLDDSTQATVADDNLTITCDSDSKFPGKYDTSLNHYRLRYGSGHALILNGAYTITIDGITISQSGTGNSDECFRCVPGTADTVTVKNFGLRCENSSPQQDCLYTGFNTSIGTIHLEQGVLTGAGRGGVNIENHWSIVSGTIDIVACGFTNNGRQTNGGGGIVANGDSSNTLEINNHSCWSIGNDGAANAQDWKDGGSTAPNAWNVSYCIDGDGSIATDTDGGTGNLASRTLADTDQGSGNFVIIEETAAGSEDLALQDLGNGSNNAQDAHTVLTAHGLSIPDPDIIGTARPQNTSYDIGPFEINASTVSAPPDRIRRTYQQLLTR